jgi:tRNA A-37 threonylcarbamoyl transferase component Bud32
VLQLELLSALRQRGPCEHLNLSGPISSNPGTYVFRGECDVYPKPVAIKLHWNPKKGTPDPGDARATFLALQNVERLLRSDPECRCALPIDFFEELGIVIMDWVDGKTLDRILLRRSARDCETPIRMAGAWLARLHVSTLRAPRTLDVARILSALDEHVKGPAKGPRGGPILGAFELLHATAELVSREPVPWALVHGDFKPSNLFWSSGRIVGIDAQLVYEDAAVFDAAHFLNHLAIHLRWRPWATGRRGSALLDSAFIAGYEHAGTLKLPGLPLLWARLLNALRLVIWYRTWSRSPLTALTVMQLEGAIRSLSRDLAAAHDKFVTGGAD